MGCAGSKGLTEFQRESLNCHNNYRSRHGAPAMSLNKQLCGQAQKYAETLAKKKKLQHADPKNRRLKKGSVGENLAMAGTSDANHQYPASHFVDNWYNESRNYNYNRQGFSSNTGHFTQVVWKGSTQLGIGTAKYKDGQFNKTVVVGRYYPAGNVQGEFDQNVAQR